MHRLNLRKRADQVREDRGDRVKLAWPGLSVMWPGYPGGRLWLPFGRPLVRAGNVQELVSSKWDGLLAGWSRHTNSPASPAETQKSLARVEKSKTLRANVRSSFEIGMLWSNSRAERQPEVLGCEVLGCGGRLIDARNFSRLLRPSCLAASIDSGDIDVPLRYFLVSVDASVTKKGPMGSNHV